MKIAYLKKIIQEELRLLNEGFKEKAAQFIKQGSDPEEVQAVFDQFKKLKDKNRLSNSNIDTYKTLEDVKSALKVADTIQSKSDTKNWVKFFTDKGYDENKVKPVIRAFAQNVQNGLIVGDEANIESYSSLEDIAKANYISFQSENSIDKSEYEILRNDESVTIIKPLTQKASCYFGSKDWCISYTNDKSNKFKDYSSEGKKFLFILDKKKDTKIAISFIGNKIEAFDENDKKLNPEKILSRYDIADEWIYEKIIIDFEWLRSRNIKWENNDDGSIDILDNLNLSELGLTELPFESWT